MKRFWGILLIPLLALFVASCASVKAGVGAPVLSVNEDGAKIQGRWVDPKNDPLKAFDKIERNKSTLANMTEVGFDPEARVIGGQPRNKEERKRVEEAFASKPTKLEGPEAYKLYEQMLFPGGTSNQVITEELREKRQAEVGLYTAYVFVLENIRNKKDRIWFSTSNKLKVGYRYELKFILKDGVVVEKDKKEEHYNDPSKESSFGKGGVEFIQGVRSLIPIPVW